MAKRRQDENAEEGAPEGDTIILDQPPEEPQTVPEPKITADRPMLHSRHAVRFKGKTYGGFRTQQAADKFAASRPGAETIIEEIDADGRPLGRSMPAPKPKVPPVTKKSKKSDQASPRAYIQNMLDGLTHHTDARVKAVDHFEVNPAEAMKHVLPNKQQMLIIRLIYKIDD